MNAPRTARKESTMDMVERLLDEKAALRAENQRLREALDPFVNPSSSVMPSDAKAAAIAALKGPTMANVAPWTSSYPVMWDVVCPHCGEGVGNPDNGSYHWTQVDFENQGSKIEKCVACEGLFRAKPPRFSK